MKALIVELQPVEDGFRVAQVEPDDAIFPVAEGMYWVDCTDNIVQDKYYYHKASGAFVRDTRYNLADPEPQTPRLVGAPQPVVTGAMTL